MKRQLHLASKLCHEFHQDQQLPCQKTECRLWDDQLAGSQNCTAIQAKQGPHTLQALADMRMVPKHESLEGYVDTKMGTRLRINEILEKCLSRSARGRQEWTTLQDIYELEEL